MTRDILLSQTDSTDDVMLASEVARYQLIQRQAYARLYEGRDLKTLIHAMEPMQRLHFAGDCLKRALRYQEERGNGKDRDEMAFAEALHQYADGEIGLRRLYHHWQTCSVSFPMRHLAGTELGLWAANSSADWLTWKASKWGKQETEFQWELDRVLGYLTSLS